MLDYPSFAWLQAIAAAAEEAAVAALLNADEPADATGGSDSQVLSIIARALESC